MKKNLLLLALLLPFFLLLFKISYQRFAMFGCFDECINYLGGYFIIQGKVLYGDYFFPHQMLAAYLSSAIQLLSHPQSIYHLVLYHRIFIFFFALLMDIFIILRFGKLAVLFVLLFESIKFYYMGSLFLPESIIVYFMVYLLALMWKKFSKQNISTLDYAVSGLFTTLVIFMREPYILATLFMYAAIMWGNVRERAKLLSVGILVSLSLIILAFTDLKSYFHEVWFINIKPIFEGRSTNKLGGLEFLKIFLYPFYIFISGKSSFLRDVLIALSAVFVFLSGILVIRFKKYIAITAVLIVLGLSNIRFVEPGVAFYEAFHTLPWIGLFIMATLLFIKYLYDHSGRKYMPALATLVLLGLFIFLLSPKSFIGEHLNTSLAGRNSEFDNEFSKYIVNGEVIRLLSNKNDTLFVDLWDDLIYWQAKLDSSYKYTNYWAQQAVNPEYGDLRLEMFRKTPPDFYYYACSDKQYASPFLPEFVVGQYVQLYYINRPSCLYVKKTKITGISPSVWDKIRVLRFYLPEYENRN